MTHLELLQKLDACADAVEWSKGFETLEAAWNGCRRSDWMLSLLREIGFDNPRILRLYACACVRRTPIGDGRTVWDLLTDERSKNAVLVAENFANGLATEEELAAARTAAVAARSARAAARAAGDVGAAARAARAAAELTRDAAWIAAGDEEAADREAWDASCAARDAAGAAAGAAQCNILREMLPFSIVQKHVDKLCAKWAEEAVEAVSSPGKANV